MKNFYPDVALTGVWRKFGTFLMAALVCSAIPACSGGKGSGVPSTPCEQDPDGCVEPPPPPPTPVPLTSEFLNQSGSVVRVNGGVAIRFSRAISQASITGNVRLEPITDGTVSGSAFALVLDEALFSDSSGTVALFRSASGDWPVEEFETEVRLTVTQGIKAADDQRSLETEAFTDLIIAINPDTSISLPSDILVDGKSILSTIYTNTASPAYSMSLGEPLLFRAIGSGEDPICNNQSPVLAIGGFIASGILGGLLFEPDTEVQCTVTLRFWDLAGNTGDIVFEYAYDDVAPLVPFIEPEELFPGNLTPDSGISIDVTPVSDPTAVSIEIAGGNGTVTRTIALATENIDVLLNSGVNSLQIRVIDRAGNRGAAALLTVTRDNASPVVTSLQINSQGLVPRQLQTDTATTVNGTELNATDVPFLLSFTVNESVTVQVIDVANPLTPLAEETRPPGIISPVSFNLPAAATVTLQVVVTDVVGNAPYLSSQFTVTTDTTLDPALAVTEVMDGSTPAYEYATGQFRTRTTEPGISGVAEHGLQVELSGLGLLTSWVGDPADDVFPATGEDISIRTGLNTVTAFSAEVMDPAGNTGTELLALAVLSDQIEPDAPEVTGVTSNPGCSVTLFELDSSTWIGRLVGDIEDCGDAAIEVEVLEDQPEPEAGGATFVVSELDGIETAESPLLVQEEQHAEDAPFTGFIEISSLNANSVQTVRLWSRDRAGNDSGYIHVHLLTQTEADDPLAPVILSASNDSTGGRPDALLDLLAPSAGVYETSASNAGQIIVSGVTAPGSEVDIFAGAPPATGSSLFDLAFLPTVTADSNSGFFQLSIRPDTEFPWSDTTPLEIQSFTIRTTQDSVNYEIELRITRDETAPGPAPGECDADVSPVSFSGDVNVATIRIPGTCFEDVQRTELVVQNLGAGSPACAVASPNPSESVFLEDGLTTALQIEAAPGDRLQVYYRDDAGNTAVPADRDCYDVPDNRYLLIKTGTDLSVPVPQLATVDIDAPVPEYTVVPVAPEGTPVSQSGGVLFYGTDRLLDLNVGDDSVVSLRSFDFAGGNEPALELLDEQILDITGISFSANRDHEMVAMLSPGTTEARIREIAVNGSTGLITGTSDISFPGSSISSNFIPIGVALVPPASGKPVRAMVLRFAFALTELPGDLLQFNLDTNLSMFPAEPFVNTSNGSKRGYTTCKSPQQVAVAKNGLRAFVVCNSTSPNDTDVTSVNLSPPVAQQSDAFSLNLSYLGSPLSGLLKIATLPATGSVILGSSSGVIYLVTDLDTPAPTVEAVAGTPGSTITSIQTTADGERVLVFNGTVVDVYSVGATTLTYLRTLTLPIEGLPIVAGTPLP